jgi:hypothetical protein
VGRCAPFGPVPAPRHTSRVNARSQPAGGRSRSRPLALRARGLRRLAVLASASQYHQAYSRCRILTDGHAV